VPEGANKSAYEYPLLAISMKAVTVRTRKATSPSLKVRLRRTPAAAGPAVKGPNLPQTVVTKGIRVRSDGHDEGRRTQTVAGSFPDARTETSSRSGEIE
jgi:hypothetical protein